MLVELSLVLLVIRDPVLDAQAKLYDWPTVAAMLALQPGLVSVQPASRWSALHQAAEAGLSMRAVKQKQNHCACMAPHSIMSATRDIHVRVRSVAHNRMVCRAGR